MFEIVEKSNCIGCRVCQEICPKNAISFVINDEGFLIPEINDSKCILCYKCKNICPMNNQIIKKKTNASFIGIIKDEKEFLNSSSGGAFTAIINSFTDENIYVCGAKYNTDFSVSHEVLPKSEISVFRKSKYVQSDLKNSFENIKRIIENGKRVIFTGTPCQVHALNIYLKNNKFKENLLTVDLICTGVCSSVLLREFINISEKKYNGTVSKIDMRYKNANVFNKQMIEINDKTITDRNAYLFRNLYGSKVAYNENCYNCQFATEERCSDITIGDWWGSVEKLSQIQNMGCSVIMFNSDKSMKLKDSILSQMNYSVISIDEIKDDNPTLYTPSIRPKGNVMFKRYAKKRQYNKILKRYGTDSFRTKLYLLRKELHKK